MNLDRRLSVAGACLNLLGVLGFAVSMLSGPQMLPSLTSIFIAWGLCLMNCGFCVYARDGARAAALGALVFGGMYALCNSLVYFIQITTVVNTPLSGEAANLLDYGRFGMIFNLDMLGYCLMAISTFFAGFTIRVRDRGDRWLKGLLLAHGAFAFACFILPMLGMFGPDKQTAPWVGIAILEFWCAFFTPVGILSLRYFLRQKNGI